jgi:hypothetical protein
MPLAIVSFLKSFSTLPCGVYPIIVFLFSGRRDLWQRGPFVNRPAAEMELDAGEGAGF